MWWWVEKKIQTSADMKTIKLKLHAGGLHTTFYTSIVAFGNSFGQMK